MPAQPKAIVFDYGDVLSYPVDPSRYDRLAQIGGLRRELLLRRYRELRPDYDRGVISGPEYWRRIASSGSRTLSDEQIRRLVEEDTRNTPKLNPMMLGWAVRLVEAGIAIGILSNMTMDDMHEIARHRIRESLALFSVQVFSSEIGLVKPEEGIYRYYLAALGCEPSQTLFIDDKAENVRAARKLGMNAFRFRSFQASVPILVRAYRLPGPPIVPSLSGRR